MASNPEGDVALTNALAETQRTMQALDFAEVVELHLTALALPFSRSWLEPHNANVSAIALSQHAT